MPAFTPGQFTGAVAKDPVGYAIIPRCGVIGFSHYSLNTVLNVINMAKRVVWSPLRCLYNLITIVSWIGCNAGKITINLIWIKACNSLFLCALVTSLLM